MWPGNGRQDVHSRGGGKPRQEGGFYHHRSGLSVCSEQVRRFPKRRLPPHQSVRTDGLVALRVLATMQHYDGRPISPEQAGEWLSWIRGVSATSRLICWARFTGAPASICKNISTSSSTGSTGASGKWISPCTCSAHVWTIGPSDWRLKKVKKHIS